MFLLKALFILALVILTSSQTLKFPKGFNFGTSTASYQVEGAYNQGGRGLSIWDVFSHEGKCYHGETGDVADNHYNLVDQDVKLMQAMGLKHYRMSLSWNRIFRDGFPNTLNQEGIDHYNNEFNLLLANGITPFVTLFHWDLPQAIELEHQGWLSPVTSDLFAVYAETCFKLFGDRVKNWLTLNEPHTVAINGYLSGQHAPGRCSNRTICPHGNSDTEPYIAAYHMLLAHGKAAQIYRQKYQKQQNGQIGIALDCAWGQPVDPKNPGDVEASSRFMEFFIGWFADPIWKGDYPESMKLYVGDRLPPFTEEQKAMLKGSVDFFALNHYTSTYTTPLNSSDSNLIGWYKDMHVLLSNEKDGVPIGPQADSSWLFVVPYGMRNLLVWLNHRYGPNIDFVITENGVDVPGENAMPLNQALNDTFRVNFYTQYLSYLSQAIYEDKVNVKAYFAWSFMDNFEWADGYSKRFGIHYVEYATQTRYPKESSKFFANLIKTCCQED